MFNFPFDDGQEPAYVTKDGEYVLFSLFGADREAAPSYAPLCEMSQFDL